VARISIVDCSAASCDFLAEPRVAVFSAAMLNLSQRVCYIWRITFIVMLTVALSLFAVSCQRDLVASPSASAALH
jgi:hypothetical protein